MSDLQKIFITMVLSAVGAYVVWTHTRIETIEFNMARNDKWIYRLEQAELKIKAIQKEIKNSNAGGENVRRHNF